MSADLVLYSHPMSRGRIARWMLEEVGQPYEVRYLDYATSMKAPEYLALNPLGKVPALVHRGAVVTEGAAICAYLADAFPTADLAPAHGAPARADYYRWLFFGAGPLEAAITNKALGVEVPSEKRGFVGYGDYTSTLDALEHAVTGRRYIVGDRFSAADVYVGSQIGFGLRFNSIDPRPAFVDYWQGLAERPALARANEADDKAMVST